MCTYSQSVFASRNIFFVLVPNNRSYLNVVESGTLNEEIVKETFLFNFKYMIIKEMAYLSLYYLIQMFV